MMAHVALLDSSCRVPMFAGGCGEACWGCCSILPAGDAAMAFSIVWSGSGDRGILQPICKQHCHTLQDPLKVFALSAPVCRQQHGTALWVLLLWLWEACSRDMVTKASSVLVVSKSNRFTKGRNVFYHFPWQVGRLDMQGVGNSQVQESPFVQTLFSICNRTGCNL